MSQGTWNQYIMKFTKTIDAKIRKENMPIPPPRVDSSKGPPWTGWGVQKNVDFGPISPSSPYKNQLAYRIFRLGTIRDRLT